MNRCACIAALYCLSLSSASAIAGVTTRFCPTVKSIQQRSYHLFVHNSEHSWLSNGSWLFESTDHQHGMGAFVYVNHAGTEKQARKAVNAALSHLKGKLKIEYGHCIYAGGLEKLHASGILWASSYPTVGFW